MDQQNERSILQSATQDAGTHRFASADISAPSHTSRQNDAEHMTNALGINEDVPEEAMTEARRI